MQDLWMRWVAMSVGDKYSVRLELQYLLSGSVVRYPYDLSYSQAVIDDVVLRTAIYQDDSLLLVAGILHGFVARDH